MKYTLNKYPMNCFPSPKVSPPHNSVKGCISDLCPPSLHHTFNIALCARKQFTFDLNNESFYHLQSPQKLSLSSRMKPLSVLYVLQTNKLFKMY